MFCPPRIPTIDALESLSVDHGWSVAKIAKRYGLPKAQVEDQLVDVGLEVEGRVKLGYLSQAQALMAVAGKPRSVPIDYDEVCWLLMNGKRKGISGGV